jgi:hypothetical protein
MRHSRGDLEPTSCDTDRRWYAHHAHHVDVALVYITDVSYEMV